MHENTLEKNVDIVGWISGDAKERLLSTSSIFILPSYNEGFPISILEAMSAGIPIIASTVGGIPDAIKSGEDGTLVAPGDLEALYTALKDAFTNNNKHQSYAKKAKIKFDSNFSLPVITSKISAVYSSITSETK
ncbi:D-inositol 3-phosphate glycosyltransferase [compost metagenome]